MELLLVDLIQKKPVNFWRGAAGGGSHALLGLSTMYPLLKHTGQALMKPCGRRFQSHKIKAVKSALHEGSCLEDKLPGSYINSKKIRRR